MCSLSNSTRYENMCVPFQCMPTKCFQSLFVDTSLDYKLDLNKFSNSNCPVNDKEPALMIMPGFGSVYPEERPSDPYVNNSNRHDVVLENSPYMSISNLPYNHKMPYSQGRTTQHQPRYPSNSCQIPSNPFMMMASSQGSYPSQVPVQNYNLQNATNCMSKNCPATQPHDCRTIGCCRRPLKSRTLDISQSMGTNHFMLNHPTSAAYNSAYPVIISSSTSLVQPNSYLTSSIPMVPNRYVPNSQRQSQVIDLTLDSPVQPATNNFYTNSRSYALSDSQRPPCITLKDTHSFPANQPFFDLSGVPHAQQAPHVFQGLQYGLMDENHRNIPTELASGIGNTSSLTENFMPQLASNGPLTLKQYLAMEHCAPQCLEPSQSMGNYVMNHSSVLHNTTLVPTDTSNVFTNALLPAPHDWSVGYQRGMSIEQYFSKQNVSGDASRGSHQTQAGQSIGQMIIPTSCSTRKRSRNQSSNFVLSTSTKRPCVPLSAENEYKGGTIMAKSNSRQKPAQTLNHFYLPRTVLTSQENIDNFLDRFLSENGETTNSDVTKQIEMPVGKRLRDCNSKHIIHHNVVMSKSVPARAS